MESGAVTDATLEQNDWREMCEKLERVEAIFNAKDAEIATLRAELEKMQEVMIEEKPPTLSLPWKPHEGAPHMTPSEALRLYHEKRSDALCRTVMTDEQRANFVGDAKPS
jgi:hypothetical protein